MPGVTTISLNLEMGNLEALELTLREALTRHSVVNCTAPGSLQTSVHSPGSIWSGLVDVTAVDFQVAFLQDGKCPPNSGCQAV